MDGAGIVAGFVLIIAAIAGHYPRRTGAIGWNSKIEFGRSKKERAVTYTFHEYQVDAEKTANFQVEDPLLYCIIGAAGEAGETLEKIKKLARKHATYNVHQFIDPATRVDILRELGDQLWYIAIAAKLLGCDLATVAALNIEKLADRQNRGVIIGAGDDR